VPDYDWVVVCTLTDLPLLGVKGVPIRYTEEAAKAEAERMTLQASLSGMTDFKYIVRRLTDDERAKATR
jgi:hypothetical protein